MSDSPSSRRRYSAAYKLQVVQASQVADASMAQVAFTHGLNLPQLYQWRWQYRRGDLGGCSPDPAWVAVQVSAASATSPPSPSIHAPPPALEGDRMELILPAGRVLVRGAVDLATLRGVIEALRA